MSSEKQPEQPQPQAEPPAKPKQAPEPKTFLRYSSRPAKDFFDKFRDGKLCTIPTTSRVKKPDAFLAMRPNPGTCLDYSISETDTKLDTGMTKIHIRQVNAAYERLPLNVQETPPPAPLKKRKRNPFHNKYCHAREPVYEFAETKYARKIERMQEFSKKKMIERIANSKLQKKGRVKREHEFMLELCGPDWFIELSIIQKETVDNLKEAINHDLKFGEITETFYLLGRLGILLRPNRKIVEIALKRCCKCPVEFLLTLYQLMKPNRTLYSLNDMLILSSVVHLTMKSTLKEMHIRLPSPPPPLKRIKPKPKRPKKITYDSPYLKPVVYVHSKPTALETWRNRHITFPKNPYFAYLKDLREVPHTAFTIRSRLRVLKEKVSAQETAILENELMAAQSAFNKMHDYYEHENVQLLKANIHHTCNHQTSSGTNSNRSQENTWKLASETDDKATTTTLEETTVSVAVEMKVTETIDDNNNHTMTVYQCQVDTRVEKGSTDIISQENEESVSSDSSGSERDRDERIEVEEELCTCQNETCMRNRGTNVEEQPKLIEVKKRTPSNCTCRQIIEKRIKESTCQCERCKANIERANIKTTYVISDTKMEPDGPVPIISDVWAERKCTCMERYLRRVNRIDHQKDLRRAHEHLIDMGQPFIVNGVAIGPDGNPVYNLSSGVAVQTKCRCLWESHKTPDSSNRAIIPMGRQKYAISGVHATPEGNIFIISSALPIKPCDCMKLYNQYVTQHDPCMQLYNAYMDKIKFDTEEYMDDLRNRNIDEDDDSTTSSSSVSCFSGTHDGELEGGPIEEEQLIVQVVNKSSEHESSDHEENYDETCFTLDVEFEKKAPRTEKHVCICRAEEGEEKASGISSSNPSEAVYSDLESEYISDDEPTENERYIILKRIPLDRPAQVDIIKRLLCKLAQDKFPLARLPDCHKLPIFKLWMAKRTYRYWTAEDRITTLGASKDYWNHIRKCRAYRSELLTLGISNAQANNFTWLDAKLIRDYTSKRMFDYQQLQRQLRVAAAREFFPSLFMYEFPTVRFFETYFAYMPTKEEDVLYHNVWKSSDFRNLIMNRLNAKVYRCSKLV